ncbi:MAG: hypothetical protein M1814_000428 [Vezdaea aestivalis]|nr:MAG: hypothetical protein M1814_000428 [Vezdaea aestivalis]
MAAESCVFHRDVAHIPQTVIHGDGLYLTLESGQVILDATGGAAVACLGHGNERVRKAISQQMSRLSYCHSFTFSSAAAEALCNELIESTQGRMARAFIVSSGSEAMDGAMKLARQFFLEKSPPETSRYKFIARRLSYHGTTLGSLSVGGHLARRQPFEPLLAPIASHISACNPYRHQAENESSSQYVLRLAEELEEEFQRLGPSNVCAFVAEPIVGAALGCVPFVPGYFKAMKEVCNRHGALLIMDEVMCGMGRCGTLHAWTQTDIVPDIQTIGKGLGGGYMPVAGFLVNHRVIDTLNKGSRTFCHGQTYQGHPVACAAALEVQRIIKEESPVANVVAMGKVMYSLLQDQLGSHPHIGDIRGAGLFWGIEFVKDRSTKRPFAPESKIGSRIHELALTKPYSISLYPGSGTVDGIEGDHILLAPPYNVTIEQVQEIAHLTAQVVETFFADIIL